MSHVFLWVSDYDQQRNIPLASRNFQSHSVVSYIIIIVISRDWLFHYPGFQNENNNDGDWAWEVNKPVFLQVREIWELLVTRAKSSGRWPRQIHHWLQFIWLIPGENVFVITNQKDGCNEITLFPLFLEIFWKTNKLMKLKKIWNQLQG